MAPIMDVLNDVFARELNPKATAKPAFSTPEAWVQELDKRYNDERSPEFRSRIRVIKKLWYISDFNAELLSYILQSSKSNLLASFASDFYALSLECTDPNKSYTIDSVKLAAYQTKLFAYEPTAVLRGMVTHDTIPCPDAQFKQYLTGLFDIVVRDGVDITRSSTRAIVRDFLKEKPDEKIRQNVADRFQAIQRLQAVVPAPELVAALIKAGYTSAEEVVRSGRDQLDKAIPDNKIANIIWDRACVISTRNDQAWIMLIKSKSQDLFPAEPVLVSTAPKVTEPKTRISFETLFNEVDTPSCEQCCSVFSPSAYFVDLLRFLRENTADWKPLPNGSKPLDKSRSMESIIVPQNSVLAKLFERRRDLEDLELSCANTNTPIAYLDLVHEILQSFTNDLVNQPPASSERNRKTVTMVSQSHETSLIDNSDREGMIDYDLHQKAISGVVYPPNIFPYHAGTDTIATLLQKTGTTRLEVLDTFMSLPRATRLVANTTKGPSETDRSIMVLGQETINRARAALILGMQWSDFVQITGEAILSYRAYSQGLNASRYTTVIGLQPVHKQWGYDTEDLMLAEKEEDKKGLCFIQKQFLPRSGLSFQELIEILSTQFLGRRLVLTAASKAKTFTGQMAEFRLRSSPTNSGSSTWALSGADIRSLGDVMAFTRLLHKLCWTVSDLDAAISCLQRTHPAPSKEASITGDTLVMLSAIHEINGLTGIIVQRLLPLWGVLNTFGSNSLFVTMFSSQSVQHERDHFQFDENGAILFTFAELKEVSTTLKLGLEITEEEFTYLLSFAGLKLTTPLDLASLSLLCRYRTLCHVFKIPVQQLSKFFQVHDREILLEHPRTTLSALKKWKLALESGLSVSDIFQATIPVSRSIELGELEFALASFQQQTILNMKGASLDHETILNVVQTELPGLEGKDMDTLLKLEQFLSPTTTNKTGPFSSYQLLESNWEGIKWAYYTCLEAHERILYAPSTWAKGDEFKVDDVVIPIAPGTGQDQFLQAKVKFEKDRVYLMTSSKPFESWTWKVAASGTVTETLSKTNVKDGVISMYCFGGLAKIVTRLKGLITVMNAARINADELAFLAKERPKSMRVDLMNPSLENINRILRYKRLRDAAVANGATSRVIMEFWRSCAQKLPKAPIYDQLVKLMNRPKSMIQTVVENKYPGLTLLDIVSIFEDTAALEELFSVFDFVSRTHFMDSDMLLLFQIANPPHPLEPKVEFVLARQLSECVRKRLSLASPDTESMYSAAIGDVIDRCRQSLIQYLLNNPYMRFQGIYDADDLFEYFLIDVSMGPGLKTSRMKQAISTIQLFVQRCILRLEPNVVLSPDFKEIWKWMQSYGLWEANRKVFIYPENYVDPTLRDDKSEAFQQLESQMMQSNLDEEKISQLVKTYVYDVNHLSDLQVEAYLWDTQHDRKRLMHLFARTKNAPFYFYYRCLIVRDPIDAKIFSYWGAWSKLDMDIPVIEADDEGKTFQRPGSYLIPTIRNRRLFLFMPQILLKKSPASRVADTENRMGQRPKVSWEIKMGWSEHRNGVWSAKKTSQACVTVGEITDAQISGFFEGVETVGDLSPIDEEERSSFLPPIEKFKFIVRSSSPAAEQNKISEGVQELLKIDVETSVLHGSNNKIIVLGRFQMREFDVIAIPSHEISDVKSGEVTIDSKFHKCNHVLKPNDRIAMNRQRPTLLIRVGKSNQAPVLVNSTADDSFKSKKECQLSWTMSFDETQYPRPTGFVVDLKTIEAGSQTYILSAPRDAQDPKKIDERSFQYLMNNEYGPKLMEAATTSEGLSTLFSTLSSMKATHEAWGSRLSPTWHEQAMPFSLYNWELGFHAVSLLVERLLAVQQLDLALDVCKYVFNPEVSDISECWRFFPFQEKSFINGQSIARIVESLTLQPTTLWNAVEEWRDNPFAPHVIARSWPVTYMKRIVIKYIEILLASGDKYFRECTLESMPLAIQRYVQASHMFGAKPREYPRLGKSNSKTFKELIANKLNAFSNSSVDLELDFPFMRESLPRGSKAPSNTFVPGKPGWPLLGVFKSGYFCVPANPAIAALRDLIDDRLYKIRNCQDINGQGIRLSLFEPPLDPMALVEARAAGFGSGPGGFSPSLKGPVTSARFNVWLQQALELCSELKSLSDQYLTIKEKKDTESLDALYRSQDKALNKMVLDIKNLESVEATKTLESLRRTRLSHESRLSYYRRLIGEKDTGHAAGAPWKDIEIVIEQPSKDELRMSSNEKEEFKLADLAAKGNQKAQELSLTAGALLALPGMEEELAPLGMGTSIQFDASNLADLLICFSDSIALAAQQLNDRSARAGRKAQLIRQLQDRQLNANMAGWDIASIDQEIAAQEIQAKICESEIKLQEKQMAQAREIDVWMRGKYTNERLYAWMDNNIAKIFLETYNFAWELAKKVKDAYRYERPNDEKGVKLLKDSGYWNPARDGIFSANALYLALKRLEIEYNSKDDHDYEITKVISLRQLNPAALLKLRATGSATFDLPEVLFEFDFPGQILRRIKSVSMSIPCVLPPYTSVSCMLSCSRHRFRVLPAAKEQDILKPDPNSLMFKSDFCPSTSIATSHASGDSGMFPTQRIVGNGTTGDFAIFEFDGERYGPFEGAGVISSWSLDLPNEIRQFDYNTISDVVLRMQYTSTDANNETARSAGIGAVKKFINGQTGEDTLSMAFFDIPNDYATEWAELLKQATPNRKTASLKLGNLTARLPFWTRDKKVIAVKSTFFVGGVSGPAVKISRKVNNEAKELKLMATTEKDWSNIKLLQDATVGSTNKTPEYPMDEWSFDIGCDVNGGVPFKECYIVVQYKVL